MIKTNGVSSHAVAGSHAEAFLESRADGNGHVEQRVALF